METIFLSTPSARRATRVADLLEIGLDISIHALREEGDPELITKQEDTDAISIHALREEGDCNGSSASAERIISIHALREEGDMAAINAR